MTQLELDFTGVVTEEIRQIIDRYNHCVDVWVSCKNKIERHNYFMGAIRPLRKLLRDKGISVHWDFEHNYKKLVIKA